MKAYALIFSALFIFGSLSCDMKSSEVAVAGKIGEILIVTDKGIWESDLKECLDTSLTQWIMPYMPDVATFELIHKTPSHFSRGVKRYRNVLFINIAPKFKGKIGSIVKRKDVWAKGQLVIDIKAKDYTQLVKTCVEGLDEVHDAFDEIEWRRLIRNFKKTQTQTSRSKIKENFGVDVVLPSNSSIVTSRDNFYRIEFPPSSRPIEFAGTGTQDVGSILSGLMIYQYDFIDSAQFSQEALLRARDTMLKHNVPHEIDGLFMGTQYYSAVYPEGNVVKNASETINGYEMRGMFMFTGRPIQSTGGAFWSYHFINPKTKKLICFSGYVDAPVTASWTHPLREIQAIIRSVEFIKK